MQAHPPTDHGGESLELIDDTSVGAHLFLDYVESPTLELGGALVGEGKARSLVFAEDVFVVLSARVCPECGTKWGTKPHVAQPIPAELDLAETARNPAPHSST